VFTDYILSEAVQRRVLAAGFRPANPAVTLGYPIVPELGVDPKQPTHVLEVPSPPVVAAIQASWQLVKKQADVLLLMDVSSSMIGEKIQQARQAALAFLDKLPSQNRVGLMTFGSEVASLMPLGTLEQTGGELKAAIENLQAHGSTVLYDAVLQAVNSLQAEDSNRIRAIILLSDGADTASHANLRDVTAIARGERNPVLIFPVAYGSDADINTLNTIARFSSTRVLSGDPRGIQQLFELLGSYF
jgi:Ca-activated chloride channel family protein